MKNYNTCRFLLLVNEIPFKLDVKIKDLQLPTVSKIGNTIKKAEVDMETFLRKKLRKTTDKLFKVKFSSENGIIVGIIYRLNEELKRKKTYD